jgi:hypothetical protein
MYWLQRPPYLRRAAAVALVAAAFAWDLRGSSTEVHPFAARAIAAGSPIDQADLTWRRIPEGSFDVPELTGRVAAVDLAAGDPISGSVLAPPTSVPAGWWAVPVDVGAHAVTGEPVLLVVTDPPLTVGGIVVSTQRGDPYSLDYRPALVAVPGEVAPVIAAAGRAGLLVTAVRP